MIEKLVNFEKLLGEGTLDISALKSLGQSVDNGSTSNGTYWVSFDNGLQIALATIEFNQNSNSFVSYNMPLSNFKILYVGHSTVGSFGDNDEMNAYRSIVLRSVNNQWQLRAMEPHNSTRTIVLFAIGIRN